MKKIEKSGKTYLELPEGAEVIEVKEGILLVLWKEKEKKEEPRASEKSVLMKLYGMPFKDRKLKSLGGKFTKEEIVMLKKLLKEGKLFIHKKGESKFIAFTDKTFKELREEIGKKPTYGEEVSYAILTESEAKAFLEKVGRRFLAIKHFDGKVYAAERGFLQRSAKRVKSILKEGPMHIEEISRKAEMDEKAVLVVLRLLNESAEVIELKKGLFSLAE